LALCVTRIQPERAATERCASSLGRSFGNVHPLCCAGGGCMGQLGTLGTAFTRQLQDVLVSAGDEAQRYNHQWVGTEHLLLALTLQRDSVADRILTTSAVDVSAVRDRIDFIVRRGEGPGISPPGLTLRAWKVLGLALLERKNLDHLRVTTGHLVLGMLAEPEGIAGRVLEEHGVSIDAVRREVRSAAGSSTKQ